MSETDWRVVVARLRQRTSTPSYEQTELARLTGLELPPATPRPVAASMLRRLLGPALDLDVTRDVTPAQREYVTALRLETGSETPTDLDDRDVLDAWVAVLQARRAAIHLERLQPVPGDIVTYEVAGEERLGGSAR